VEAEPLIIDHQFVILPAGPLIEEFDRHQKTRALILRSLVRELGFY
jgi:hypothetical protein